MTDPTSGRTGHGRGELVKPSLDKDLGKIVKLEKAARKLTRKSSAVGASVLFLAVAGLFAAAYAGGEPRVVLIVIAAMLGGYMALNIGANDVANNVAPAVGSKALTMFGALIIAAIFESGGAIIAGGDVVSTIKKGIIDPALVPDTQAFIYGMMAALLAAALWLNLATYVGAPVSTTHSIVGGVMGGGIAAAGFSAVNWATMAKIAASWVISPLMGGIIAAAFLAFIKINIIYQDDKIAAARRWVPVLLAVMTAAFGAYLLMKGFKHVWKPSKGTVAVFAVAVFIVSLAVLRPWVRARSEGLENRNQSLRKLFHLPLIFSAALLSFAHGANDVANAIGPLAAIFDAAETGGIHAKVAVPLWIMLIGAGGISLGLLLFGPRIVRMVGDKITRMNPMRAFCVALSAAITVIVASALGLPVSSTHVAVGAVFGVGFFREMYTARSKRRARYVAKQMRLEPAPLKARQDSERKRIKRKLVRRNHFMTIIAAWVITVPLAALLAAGLFYAIDAVF